MKKIFIAALLFLCTQPAYALLSPLNQSLSEIRAILQSADLENNFPQGLPILEIRKVQNGYELLTQEWRVNVELQYLPSSYPGRQQFKLIFHQAMPLNRATP